MEIRTLKMKIKRYCRMCAGTILAALLSFTSCVDEAPEINFEVEYTHTTDFTQLIKVINDQTLSIAARIEAVEQAVAKGAATLEEASAALKDALIQALDDQKKTTAEKLDALKDAIDSQALTLADKLDLIEQAMNNGAVTVSDAIEALGTALEQAIEQGVMDLADASAAMKDAIDNLAGDLDTKLGAIGTAITDQTTTLETKLALIEAAMKAQTLSLEGKLDLLKTAIGNLPDYSSQLEAIKTAIAGLPDYSDKLDALKTAISALPDYSSKFDAVVAALNDIKAQAEAISTGQTGIATQIGNVVSAIEDLIDEVCSGNTDAAAALAAIIQKLEDLKTAIENIETGGGSGSGDSPEGALKGKFSVGAGKQVQFSKGNLVATIDASGTPTAWKFAANQYDCLGEGGANQTIGTAAGDVDLFGWSTATTTYGINTSTSSSDYSGDFKDWGTAIDGNGTWRTLSKDEWQYLFRTRTNASGLYKYGVTVCGKTHCVIIAPDGYTGTIAGSYDSSTWPAAEAAGLVCLPAAGYRKGSSVNYVGDSGSYWSSSADGSSTAYSVDFNSSAVNPDVFDYRGSRSYGYSVRLITDVAGSAPEEPAHEDPLSGKFSVGAGKQVQFSKGNLVATIDASGAPTAWKFAANQYDYLGEGGANETIGSAAGDIDLFGWSTDSNTRYGISTSKDFADYSGNFRDWGKKIGDGSTWRTLSTAEWQYLFWTRTNASGLYKYGVTVCGKTHCVIIAPDGYTGTIAGSYDSSTWPAAEAAGLVCLPAAGFRDGSSVHDVGDFGFYWSSSAYDSLYACSVYFSSGNVSPFSNDLRYYGYSVRLITDVK